MNETMEGALELLRQALWDAPGACPEDVGAVYQELMSHAVACLADRQLLRACQDPAVARQWRMEFLGQRWENERNLQGQTRTLALLEQAGIPGVILKGAAAAQYYPHPGKRLLGDVDILVPREQFGRALALLEEKGYIPRESREKDGQEVALYRDGIVFELHRGLNLEDPPQALALSRRIGADIPKAQLRTVEGHTFPALPEVSNGLVLLAHIRQHLEGGLGLRQITDWMLYAGKCLEDPGWYGGFRQEARQFGLETLAVTVTRMCQLYLGLPEENRTWCAGAEEALCRALAQYILDGGNFGRKEPGYDRATRQALMERRGLWELVSSLQTKGLRRSLVQRHPAMRPLAWSVQLCHYAHETAKRGGVGTLLHRDMKKARQLQKLLDALDDSPRG